MPSKNTYREHLKKDMADLIDQLEITDLQKRFMKARWLDQVLWLEGRANQARNRFYNLRIITIIDGVIIPALVSLNISGRAGETIRWFTFGVSQMVAISAASEEFFRYGERWKQYRNTTEGLKIEGWQFFQLSGSYQTLQNHPSAYSTFANRVETIIKKDVEVYITEVLKEKAQQEKEEKEEKDKKEEKDSSGLVKEVWRAKERTTKNTKKEENKRNKKADSPSKDVFPEY